MGTDPYEYGPADRWERDNPVGLLSSSMFPANEEERAQRRADMIGGPVGAVIIVVGLLGLGYLMWKRP